MKQQVSGGAKHQAVSTPSSKRRTLIKINLAQQVLEAFEGSTLVFRFECVSGDKEHPTDKGTFWIFRKHEHYVSKRYDARMDFAMFFTSDGKAIHQYHGPAPWAMLRAGRALTEWVGSHGCVRLKAADAKALFEWAPIKTEVRIS